MAVRWTELEWWKAEWGVAVRHGIARAGERMEVSIGRW